MKTKLVVRPCNNAIRFDEILFFSFFSGFVPSGDYKLYIEYISQKVVNLSITTKTHLKNDVINGSLINGSRQPKLYSSILDKPAVIWSFLNLKQFIIKKKK